MIDGGQDLEQLPALSLRSSPYGEYKKALRLGKRTYWECLRKKLDPYPAVLEERCPSLSTASRVDLGLREIPVELIGGTKTHGRSNSLARDFMPLLDAGTEFSTKWMALYDQLMEEGLRDPIDLLEYLGDLYVVEGNKRVSVMRYNGAVAIPAHVIRVVVPGTADEHYRDFLSCFERTGLYEVRFEKPGTFPKLQMALGVDADYVWNDDQRKRFSAGFARFKTAYERFARGKKGAIAPMDAFLAWLMYVPFSQLKDFSEKELAESVKDLVAGLEILRKGAKRDTKYPEAKWDE